MNGITDNPEVSTNGGAISTSSGTSAPPDTASAPIADMVPQAVSRIQQKLKTPSPEPAPVRYKYAVDAIAAMNSAQSWAEYNNILKANSDWLSNARFSHAAQEAAVVVNHSVTAQRMSDAAALKERSQSVQFQVAKKMINDTTEKLSAITDISFLATALDEIKTNGYTPQLITKINQQHLLENAGTIKKPVADTLTFSDGRTVDVVYGPSGAPTVIKDGKAADDAHQKALQDVAKADLLDARKEVHRAKDETSKDNALRAYVSAKRNFDMVFSTSKTNAPAAPAAANTQTKIVIQNGQRFQLNPDGTSTHLGPSQ